MTLAESLRGLLPADFPEEHGVPQDWLVAMCSVCGALPAGASPAEWWTWMWAPGEALDHLRSHQNR